jgi:protein-disulfide isomerase
MRISAVAVLMLFTMACGGGGGGDKAAPAATASDETINQRIVDYFKKAVSTPGLDFKVTKLEDADIPGWRKGNLQASLGDQKQDVAFFITKDGRYLFRGEAIDLTVDPFVATMNQISLKDQPVRGPADAKVTIVEYSDFQCPFCGKAYDTFEKEVIKDYGDKVKFVFKNFPLTQIHPWAEAAAIATECAYLQGNDPFWVMYNGLFSQQGNITQENLPAKVEEIAGASGSGIDVAKLKDCLANKQTLDAVKADMAEATEVGVTSTPSFIINGRRMNGAQDAAAFKQAIDAALAGEQPKG